MGVTPGIQLISTVTSAVVVSPQRIQAIAGNFGLSNLGELSFVNVITPGDGYADTPAPTATVRGLRGGLGATLAAQVDDHLVIQLRVVNRGSGYSNLTNANFPTAVQAFTPTAATLNLVAGQTEVLDAYYGTGRRSKEVQ